MARLTRKKEDKRRFRIMAALTEIVTVALNEGFTVRELREYMDDSSITLGHAQIHANLKVLPTPASVGYLYDSDYGAHRNSHIVKLAKRMKEK
jgi:hypothetical protein